jgi:hypothetical protein
MALHAEYRGLDERVAQVLAEVEAGPAADRRQTHERAAGGW